MMLIVQPITTYRGQQGYLVYRGGEALACLVRVYPGPLVDLGTVIGAHVLLPLMLTISQNQWDSLARLVPGPEVLAC